MKRLLAIKSALPVALIVAAAAAIAAPDSASPDPVIEGARKAAAQYTKSLPDYTAKRTTIRYKGNRGAVMAANGRVIVTDPRLTGRDIAWSLLNTVTADLTVVRGKEVYSNIRVDGKPASKPEIGGSWSSGEFSGVLDGIFAAKSAAVFRSPRKDTVNHRQSLRYDFRIDRAHSGWVIDIRDPLGLRSWAVPYSGQVWIDRETGQTLKVEMWADNLPAGVPMDSIHSLTEYEFVTIAGTNYLLPAHSEIVSCGRDGTACVENETAFKNYDKFTADTAIHFGGAN